MGVRVFAVLALITSISVNMFLGSSTSMSCVRSSEIAILFDNVDVTTERVAYEIDGLVKECYSTLVVVLEPAISVCALVQ